uniref:Uncharacterized protein n=1 Tax=Anopheles epiroticus TaxID=199890 RepID=A0A182PES1_9DIPT
MNMEFQPLPPVSTMNIGPPTPSPSPHIQILSNGPVNGNGGPTGGGGGGGGGGPGGGHNGMGPNGANGGVHSQLLGPMPPPSILPIGMPLQQVLLQAIHQNTSNNNNNNNGGNNNNNNNNTINLNNNSNGNNNNSITQYQVQQLWRHHAYLNGNVLAFFSL